MASAGKQYQVDEVRLSVDKLQAKLDEIAEQGGEVISVTWVSETSNFVVVSAWEE